MCSFFLLFFFCSTDRPTFSRVKAMGNETFYWDGLKVTSTLRPITAFLLAPFCREKAKTGRNSDNRRAMPAESTLAGAHQIWWAPDPSYLSARVQFSRLYPHRGAWSQATLFGTLFGLSRVLTTLDQIRSHFSIRKFWVSFFLQK